MHLSIWQDSRPVRPSHRWENYWWDGGSPDYEYAVRVCRTCPVLDQCHQPPGATGVWGGKIYRPKGE